jgi:exodeoxyribonuclease-3
MVGMSRKTARQRKFRECTCTVPPDENDENYNPESQRHPLCRHARAFLDWLPGSADIVCVQELKAQAADMTAELLAPAGYISVTFITPRRRATAASASIPGASPTVVEGFGIAEFDAEGRYLRADFGKLSVISLYLPSGSSSESGRQAKFRFLDASAAPGSCAGAAREVVLCGDWNIAHRRST